MTSEETKQRILNVIRNMRGDFTVKDVAKIAEVSHTAVYPVIAYAKENKLCGQLGGGKYRPGAPALKLISDTLWELFLDGNKHSLSEFYESERLIRFSKRAIAASVQRLYYLGYIRRVGRGIYQK